MKARVSATCPVLIPTLTAIATATGLDELDPTSAARQQAYQDYRAGERNAEAIAADYYARKAVQDYRQGERGEYVTPSQPIPWWQRTGEWVQQKIVQPVKSFAISVVTTIQNEHQKFQTWNSIHKDYGWTPIGIFSQKELNLIAETGKDISTYVDTLSPGNGQTWVRSYLPAVIVHWPAPLTSLGKKYGEKYKLLEALTRPMGLPGMVILPHSWEKYPNPKSMPLAHELGHVWDARTGTIRLPQGIVGGVADQLNTFIGGTVVEQNGSRFLDNTGKTYIPDDDYWYGKDENSDYEYKLYAQNSTADYLCETFNALIYNTQAFPKPEVGQWVETVIKLQADNLGKAANVNPSTITPIAAPTAPTISATPSATPAAPSPTPTQPEVIPIAAPTVPIAPSAPSQTPDVGGQR